MDDYKSFSDIQIMNKVGEYDSKALEELYDRYSPILYSLIKKIVEDKTKAEEVLADVFVLVWKNENSSNKSAANVYTWLITLARNKAVDRKRRDENPDLMPEYNDDYEDRFIIPRLSKSIDPLDLNKALSVKDNFEEALNKLTDAQNFVLYLAYYEGRTHGEIAKQLNIPVATVKSKIKVSLSNLKQNLVSGE
ncbi:MAG: sigma-70 family RNA polymerase sigma factor [Bacteroidetes bacterium]|nr:sigma-70 family RNA polymerase sigma factor [Bacteroidota bacterium]MCH8034857.1 sigma-70 family RNA polymerase sigma factor [Bacteroidota bacterium]